MPTACANNIPNTNIVQYNQASPMVGDANFKTYYENLDVPTYRLVNSYDVIPKCRPWGYVHVGAEATYGADYPDKTARHSPCCSYSYALFNPSSPYNPHIVACMGSSKPELRIP